MRWVRATDPEVEPLLAALAGEYGGRYGKSISADEMASAHPEEFDPPKGAFVVLMDGDMTVAGGGIRPKGDGTCEVKRMWTAAGYRRRGLASTVLAALEDAARELGYQAIYLQTGPLQPEASALYASSGYERVPPVDTYEGAIAFERKLV